MQTGRGRLPRVLGALSDLAGSPTGSHRFRRAPARDRRGPRRRDLLPNRLELPVALLGALRAGAEILPLAPDLPVAQIADLLGRTHTSISIGGPEVLTAAAAAGCRKGIALDRLLAEAPETGEPPPAPGGALLLTTSGTTGTPKIVRRRLAALDAVATSCARAIGVCADDRLLLTIPLHHSYGIDQGLLTAVFAGCTVELRDGFELSSVRAALQDGVTVLPAVPFLFDVLVRSEGASTWPGRSLRLAISAGGPLPRSVFDEFLAVSGVAIGQLYGATEFGSITWSDPARAGFAPQSVGTPCRACRSVCSPRTTRWRSGRSRSDARDVSRSRLHRSSPGIWTGRPSTLVPSTGPPISGVSTRRAISRSRVGSRS